MLYKSTVLSTQILTILLLCDSLLLGEQIVQYLGQGAGGGQAARDTRDFLSEKEETVAEMKRRLQAV